MKYFFSSIFMLISLAWSLTSCAQIFNLDPFLRSRFEVREITIHNPDSLAGLTGMCLSCQRILLGFDEGGRLITLEADSVLSTGGRPTQTIFIYSGDSLFLSVTRTVKSEMTTDSILEFSLYEMREQELWRKTYYPDADLNLYLAQLFPDFEGDTGELYQREMDWMKELKSIHSLNPTQKNELISELFINYRFAIENETIWDEENQVSKGLVKSEYYEFRADQFSRLELISQPNQKGSIRLSQVSFAPWSKTLRKIWNSTTVFHFILHDHWKWSFDVIPE